MRMTTSGKHSSETAQLAAEMNRAADETRRQKNADHATWIREQEAMLARIKQHGQYLANAPGAPRRLPGPPMDGSFAKPTTSSSIAASLRSNNSSRTIDTVAIYRVRNHGIRSDLATPAKAAAPRTFGDIAGRAYGDSTPSFIVSSGRGGAA